MVSRSRVNNAGRLATTVARGQVVNSVALFQEGPWFDSGIRPYSINLKPCNPQQFRGTEIEKIDWRPEKARKSQNT